MPQSVATVFSTSPEPPSAQPALHGAPDGALAQSECVVELSAVWAALCARRACCSTAFATERECGAVLRFAPEGAVLGLPIEPRALEILDGVLFGAGQNGVARQHGRSPSSVCIMMHKTLCALGFACTASRIPLFAVMAAHASRSAVSFPVRGTRLEFRQRSCLTVSMARPDVNVAGRLSVAERAVVHLLIDGLTYGEIATYRATSERTVANQVASAFRKLRVSGRIQLLSHLARQAEDSAPKHPPDHLGPQVGVNEQFYGPSR